MKKIKQREPNISIEYIVCSSDTLAKEWYDNEGDGIIDVRLAKDIESMSRLAKGRYPTFVLVDDSGELKTWSNDSFGVVAIDEVEKSFHL